MILDKEGHAEVTYYWVYTKEGDLNTPTVTRGWFKEGDEGGYVPLTKAELEETYIAGTGFYIQGNGNALRPAGQVGGDIEFDTLSSGFCVAGNGTPCDLTLGDLSVTCHGTYEPSIRKEKWSGGCKAPGGFKFMILDKEGHAEETYYWVYTKEGDLDKPTVTQGWFKDDGTGGYVQLNKDELAAIEVPAGKAFYIQGNGNTLNFPGPEL